MKKQEITHLLEDKGIKNVVLINAFQDLPEAFFLLKEFHPYSYQETDIEYKFETIEPRAIVIAKMLDQLRIKQGDKILVIGVDSVYILAALSNKRECK